MQQFDVESIITRLSGLEAWNTSRRERIERVCAKISAAGLYPITRNGIEKWFERETIPKRWQFALEQVAKHEKITLKLDRYYRGVK